MRSPSKQPFEYPANVPTMISPGERRYLYELARGLRGDGHVVEIGPWLGGSTVCLAAGMAASRANRGPWRLHTFDSFIWRPFMADRASLQLRPGQSFLPEFRKNVARFGDLVVPHRGSLPDEIVRGDPAAEQMRDAELVAPVEWNRNDPIELLFVDGAKSWTAMRHVLATFGPALVDEAWLVFQDYRFWGTWWVPSMLELIADRLELVRVVPVNTVVFRLVRTIDDEALETIPEWTRLDPDLATELLHAAARRLQDHGDTEGARVIELGHARLLVHAGQPDRAREVFARCARRWPLLANDWPLATCQAWLEEATGKPVKKDARTRLRRMLRPARCALAGVRKRIEPLRIT